MEESKLQEKIDVIMRQTNLTDIDYIREQIINKHYSISKKETTHITSVNQEIYKQLRTKMNTIMTEYNSTKEEDTNVKLG